MAIFNKDPLKSYALFVEPADPTWYPDEVVIKREYRSVGGAPIKQHCRLHRSMIPGLIEELEQFLGESTEGARG